MQTNYCFHDCKFNNIRAYDNVVEFSFPDGVYKLKGKKEDVLSGTCKVLVYLVDNETFSHVIVNEVSNGKIREVEFDDFKKSVSDYSVLIDNTYWSDFSESLLIKGYSHGRKIEIEISEVTDIKVELSV